MRAAATALAVALALPACTATTAGEAGPAPDGTPTSMTAPTEPPPPTPTTTPSPAAVTPSPEPTPAPSPTPEPLTDEELAALRVNEVGRVLVVEWHLIGDEDGEYRTSRETFRTQLQALYDRGYRPVTQAEFIAGTFPIPAGTSPVLLTFDDSTRSQFDLDDDGALVEDTAVAIIEEFAAERPQWRATAVFGYTFPQPFGDARVAAKLRWLVERGYELSNHSYDHSNLGSMSSAEVVANLARNQALAHEVVPGVPIPSLTLPFGVHAEDPSVELGGTADGVTYRHDLVYLVGAYPTRSPHDVEFDGAAVQRVPAHAVIGTGPEWFWDRLDDLDEGLTRFVSDGDPTTVTHPAELADRVDVTDPTMQVRAY